MENYKLVMPEHMNHYGYLFGGKLLSWVDEYAWIAASVEYPHCRFVTIGMNNIEFKKSVPNGSILQFTITKKKTGTSSVQYEVSVKNHKKRNDPQAQLFCTTITFVNVDDDGNKNPIK